MSTPRKPGGKKRSILDEIRADCRHDAGLRWPLMCDVMRAQCVRCLLWVEVESIPQEESPMPSDSAGGRMMSEEEWLRTLFVAERATPESIHAHDLLCEDRCALLAAVEALRGLCGEAADAIVARAGRDSEDNMKHDKVWRRLRAAARQREAKA